MNYRGAHVVGSERYSNSNRGLSGESIPSCLVSIAFYFGGGDICVFITLAGVASVGMEVCCAPEFVACMTLNRCWRFALLVSNNVPAPLADCYRSERGDCNRAA